MHVVDLRYGSTYEYKGTQRLMVIGPAANTNYIAFVALTPMSGGQRVGSTGEVSLSALIGDDAVWKLLETAPDSRA